MDDFVIPAKTRKKLEERTIQFLKIAEKYNLYFKQSKYNFDVKEIPILKVVVERKEVQMEKNKVKAVKEWKNPTKIKEVKIFLGFVNLYQCFIKNLYHMAKPLNKLKRKKEWKQDNEYQKAFKELKDKITNQLILTFLKKEGKFRVETNTSGYAIEEVLSQEQERKWKPITFLSRIIQLAERNYEIYEKELLTIVKALTKQRQYLSIGCHREI